MPDLFHLQLSGLRPCCRRLTLPASSTCSSVVCGPSCNWVPPRCPTSSASDLFHPAGKQSAAPAAAGLSTHSLSAGCNRAGRPAGCGGRRGCGSQEKVGIGTRKKGILLQKPSTHGAGTYQRGPSCHLHPGHCC